MKEKKNGAQSSTSHHSHVGQVWLGTSEAPISDPAPVDLSRAVLPGALLVDERRVSSLIPGSEYLTFTSGARGKKNTNAFLHPARAKLQSSSSSNAAPLCKHTPQGTMPHGSSMQSCSRTSRMRSAGVTLLQLSPLQEVYVSTHQAPFHLSVGLSSPHPVLLFIQLSLFASARTVGARSFSQ